MNHFIAPFRKSLKRLEEVLVEEKSITTRDAAIQRFEFTVELAWKAVQRFLREQKIVCRSPKECLKEAFKFGLIADDPRWLEMLEDRNLIVHTYNEEVADSVYDRLPKYLGILNFLKDKLEE
jgi:nucleotidyltransferase substrate binding protein (TIGR01987 family)